jgi:hypothetical protein
VWCRVWEGDGKGRWRDGLLAATPFRRTLRARRRSLAAILVSIALNCVLNAPPAVVVIAHP